MTGDSLTFLGVFLAGLGLNLTPCVYPMLSVTVSVLSGHKELHPVKAFGKAALYVLGIAVMYSSLGVAAALTGGFFGAALQNRWVLLGIAFLLVLLALSMFGVYAFQMPGWLVARAGGRRRTNLFGIFLSGLFVGVFAAPCVGPTILGLLTLIGTRGDPWLAFRVFFVMSLGLGLPYLILGTFSVLLHRLPKSGVWMIWMERVFGVFLIALAGFYFLLAVAPSLIKGLPPLALIAGGVYLGFLERSAVYPPAFVRFQKAAGTLAILAGLAIPIFAPRASVRWEVYAPEKLVHAKELKKPVILDFYADWCLPCHELDQFTYTNPQVIQALEGFVRLKVDLTRPDSPEVQGVTEHFDIMGVPTIVFLDPEGREVEKARTTGFVSAEELLKIIHAGS